MLTIRNINPHALYVHCDAGMDYTPKNPGGVGIHIEFPESVELDPIELFHGCYIGANIERLELEAIIRGMNEVLELFELYRNDKLRNVNRIIITTDRYSLNDDDKTSPFRIREWRKNNWHNHEGMAISNSDLLEKIDKTRKKLSDKTHCSVCIDYLQSKFNKTAHKLARKGKSKAVKLNTIAIMGVKQGRRKFEGEEVNYKLLKEKDDYVIHIYKKEPVRDQWKISTEFCKGEFIEKKLKIYTTPEIERKLHRHHIYRVRLKNVSQHHVTIFKVFKEIRNKDLGLLDNITELVSDNAKLIDPKEVG